MKKEPLTDPFQQTDLKWFFFVTDCVPEDDDDRDQNGPIADRS